MDSVLARCLVGAFVCVWSAADLAAQTPITFRYFYDETGQLTRVVDSTGVALEYVYDAVGNILEIKRSTVPVGALTILGLTPSRGGFGAAVEIQGQGFSTTPSGNTVQFNGTPAAVISATTSILLVLVPPGASMGPVSVTVGSTTAVSPNPFTVLAIPFITSIAPKVFDATRPPASIHVTGSSLSGSSFTVLPALAPAPVVIGTPQIDPTGTMATVPITVAANARGTFVLVASNGLGTSDAFSRPGNTFAVINGHDDLDSDGDGFPDGLELLFGSDPFDPASVPNFTLSGEVVSAALSVSNTSLGPVGSQELIGPAFLGPQRVRGIGRPKELLGPAYLGPQCVLAVVRSAGVARACILSVEQLARADSARSDWAGGVGPEHPSIGKASNRRRRSAGRSVGNLVH